MLLKDITVQYSYRQDLYPKSVEVAHDMLNKHELLNPNEKKPKIKVGRIRVKQINMIILIQ